MTKTVTVIHTIELDHLRPGGIIRIDVNGRDAARGQFVEVVRTRMVVFAWEGQGSGTRVPLGFPAAETTRESQGPGTLVRLRHGD